jgi:hypothetical protein
MNKYIEEKNFPIEYYPLSLLPIVEFILVKSEKYDIYIIIRDYSEMEEDRFTSIIIGSLSNRALDFIKEVSLFIDNNLHN